MIEPISLRRTLVAVVASVHCRSRSMTR